MKPARPDVDHTSLVREGYDRIAAEFNRTRATESGSELEPLLQVLAPGSLVLDLGCGAGMPIARTLAEAHSVVGVDISAAQLALAREQVPVGQFLQADMTHLHFKPGTFVAVVNFYAIFHTPRDGHEALIRRIGEWLAPGGYLLATFSPSREDGYTEEFFGTEMYWSNLGLKDYLGMLQVSGFEIVHQGTVGHGYSDENAKPEAHPLVLAKKVR